MRGFTLIDVLIGTALMLIVFLGVFGAFRLGIKVVSLSRAKISATSLANQRLEEARNLPYSEVGIKGVDKNGSLPGEENYSLGNFNYEIKTDVNCVLDDQDGLTPNDPCPCDYKNVTVVVSWPSPFSGEVSLSSDVGPKNDIQECEKQGGILEVAVFNAKGQPLSGVEVQVENVITGHKDYCLTDSNGECSGENALFLDVSSEPENYKIIVPKPGTLSNYSTDQTFRAGDTYNSKQIATPQKPNATILENQITEKSFSIDKLSSFSITTRSSRGKETFDDYFNDYSKISDFSNIEIKNGEATLKKNTYYANSGFLFSNSIEPSVVKGWGQLSWIDSTSKETAIKYQVFYATSTNWFLVPESDLPGNSTGFKESPVDLSNLDSSYYSKLKIKGSLSTTDSSKTPSLSEWHLSYFTKNSYLIDNVSFDLRGEKIVGTDAQEEPIYKKPLTKYIINSSGVIENLEWDTYNFSNFAIDNQSVGLEEASVGEILGDGSLSVALAPNTDQELTLYLATENTLLVKVIDSETSDPIFNAKVHLYNDNYDKTQNTDQKGETFFAPLEKLPYNLEVSAEGYSTSTSEVFVSGDSTTTVELTLSPS